MLSSACAELRPAVHQITSSFLVHACKLGCTHRHLHAADPTPSYIGLQTCTGGQSQAMDCDQNTQLEAEVRVHRKPTE